MNRQQQLLARDSRKREIDDYQSQADLHTAALTSLGVVPQWDQSTQQYRQMKRDQLTRQNLTAQQILDIAKMQQRDVHAAEKLACQIEKAKCQALLDAQTAVLGTITTEEQEDITASGRMSRIVKNLNRQKQANTIKDYAIDAANTRELGGSLMCRVVITMPNDSVRNRIVIVDSEGITVVNAI